VLLKPTRAGNARAQLISDVSTGKRISQKLLRNIVKFMSIIDDVLKILPMEFLKKSSDEVEMRGSESKYDTRRLNSYPSKVFHGHGPLLPYMHFSEFQAVYGHFTCKCIMCHSRLCSHFRHYFSAVLFKTPHLQQIFSTCRCRFLLLSCFHTHKPRVSLALERQRKRATVGAGGLIKILQMVRPSSP